MATANRPTGAAARLASPENTAPNDVATEPGARIANIGATVRTIRCVMAKLATVGVLMAGSEITVRHHVQMGITEHCARINANAIQVDVIGRVVNVWPMMIL